MSRIMTELTSEDVIMTRFCDELPRVLRWADKHIRSGKITPAHFPEEPLMVNDNPESSFYTPYTPEGVVYWESPTNKDTWGTAVYRNRYDPNDKRSLPFYYWNTAASIGCMRAFNVHCQHEDTIAIAVTTPHCLLRYKERLRLGYSGIDLITHVVGRTFQSCPRVYERNGRGTFEVIGADGVFRGPAQIKNSVFKMNTFLAWEELNPSDRKEAEALWEIFKPR